MPESDVIWKIFLAGNVPLVLFPKFSFLLLDACAYVAKEIWMLRRKTEEEKGERERGEMNAAAKEGGGILVIRGSGKNDIEHSGEGGESQFCSCVICTVGKKKFAASL